LTREGTRPGAGFGPVHRARHGGRRGDAGPRRQGGGACWFRSGM